MLGDPLSALTKEQQEILGPFLTGESSSSGEWRAYCPICEDPAVSSTPSAGINFQKGVWHCLKEECDAKVVGSGKIPALIKHIKSGTAEVVDIKTKKKIAPKPKRIPSEESVQGWHDALLGDPDRLQKFREQRGLSLKIIKEYRIGYNFDRNRYMIPIYAPDGSLISVKAYHLSKYKVAHKMYFYPEGRVSLYNAQVISEVDKVCIVEGELDTLTLMSHGIHAVSHTAGANGWRREWAAEFKGKIVYIIPDEDSAGEAGAQKIAESLDGIVAQAYMVHLGTGKPKTDVTDFLVKYGLSIKDLQKRFAEARKTPLFAVPDTTPTQGRQVTLQESQVASGEAVSIDVQVVGKITPPYHPPQELVATCKMNKGKICNDCPMKSRNGEYQVEVQPDNPGLLQFLDANEVKYHQAMVKLVGAKCSDRIAFEVGKMWELEELHVSDSIENVPTDQTLTPLTRQVFSVGTHDTETNILATLLGRESKDPRNARGVLQVWNIARHNSRIEDFKVSEHLQHLRRFRRRRGQAPLAKCLEIAYDVSSNVTGIHGRDLMHVAMDLVWHSVMRFTVLGRDVPKGWLEALIIGDTRTGKSQAAHELAGHYGEGKMLTCEGATFAGLVGGAEQVVGKKWSITWGAIPRNDGRLVVLDEMSGLKDKGIIEQMSSIRSEGRASLTKISSHEQLARTRLLWLTNAVDGRTLGEVPGYSAVPRLVNSPEDIARFDFVMAAASGDVPEEEYYAEHDVEHEFDRTSCNALVLWAWSRKPEQIRWSSEAEGELKKQAIVLGRTYIEDLPLVQAANIRFKLARIAVALAARTFSSDRTGELLLVNPEHVKSAIEFLNAVYGAEAMGYLRRSRDTLGKRAEAQKNKSKIKKFLLESPELLEMLQTIGDDKFRMQDISALDTVSGDNAVSKLLQWHMIRRAYRNVSGGGYFLKEPALIEVLQTLED